LEILAKKERCRHPIARRAWRNGEKQSSDGAFAGARPQAQADIHFPC
jgi:hypothetical protein